jgi:hypothetical protein
LWRGLATPDLGIKAAKSGYTGAIDFFGVQSPVEAALMAIPTEFKHV